MSNISISHPLVSLHGLDSLSGCSETLDFCSDHLLLLTDLFGNDGQSYECLNSAEAIRAMFRTLLDTSLVIKAVSDALKLEADDARVDAMADSQAPRK